MDSQTIANMKPADKAIALVMLTVALGAGAFGLSLALPFLIVLAQESIYFALLFGTIVVGTFLVATSWRTIYYWWMNVARNLRRAVVKSDPIGTLSTVIMRFQKQMDEIDDYIKQVDAAVMRLQKAIIQALKSRDNEFNLAETAKNQGMQLQADQHAKAAKRWEDSAERQKPMTNQLVSMAKQLKRGREFCQVRMDDTENQKTVLKQELDALLPGQSVVRKMKGFFGHNPDLEMKEMAVEEAEREATEAMAEIDNFMSSMEPMLQTQDLQQNADQIAANERFNRFLETGKGEVIPEVKAPAQITSSVKVR